MSEHPHGTPTRYTNGKCRCQPCREANTRYMREYRARKREVANGQPVHVCPHCRCES